MSLFGFLDKVMEKLPIQNRKERMKNEIDKLKKERNELLIGNCDVKKSKRLFAINDRVNELEQLLKNASDSR